MQLLREPGPPDPVRVILQQKVPEGCEGSQVIAKHHPVRCCLQAGVIQMVPLGFRHRAVHRIAVDLQDIRIEVMDRHNSSSLPKALRIVRPLRTVNQLIVGNVQIVSESVHVLIGHPQADACSKVVIPGDLIVIPEAVRTLSGDSDRDALFVFRKLPVDQIGDIPIIEPPVFLNYAHHLYSFTPRRHRSHNALRQPQPPVFCSRSLSRLL